MTRFVVVPQWQGSSSSRAMQLIDGAQAIAGDLPRSSCTVVDVPMEAGESLDSGVRRLSSLQTAARHHLEALSLAGSERVLTVGGDAGVATTAALFTIGATRGAVDPDTVVVWFAAHAGMHAPDAAPTGAFESMSARALVDAAVPSPSAGALLPPGRLILAGVRALDAAEQEAIDRLGVVVIPGDELTASTLADAIGRTGASTSFIHVALDVLDPSAIAGVNTPEPFGLSVTELVAAIASAREAAPLAGAALTGFAPASPAAAIDDLGTILRLVGALA